MRLFGIQRQLAFAIALVATSIWSVGVVSSVVSAAAPGTPAAGTIAMTPSTGNSGTEFGLSFATPQACPGDGPAGSQWTAFITAATNDLAPITFDPSGSPVTAAGFTASLRDTTQTQVKAQFPGIGDGLVNPPARLVFSSSFFNAVPAGDYWVAVSCYRADAGGINQTERFWATRVTIATTASAGPNNFTFGPSTTTTSTTVAASTTTTTVAGATTTTVAGGAATLSPAVPTAGGSYRATHPNCRIGEIITFTQPQSTPPTATATCATAVSGLVRPEQAATTGVATVTFTAPTAPGSYTVTSTGPTSGTRTTTFVITGPATAIVPLSAGGSSGGGSSGGSASGTSTGTIAATGSTTTSIIVWGVLLLVFGRMAILFGREPKVISASR